MTLGSKPRGIAVGGMAIDAVGPLNCCLYEIYFAMRSRRIYEKIRMLPYFGSRLVMITVLLRSATVLHTHRRIVSSSPNKIPYILLLTRTSCRDSQSQAHMGKRKAAEGNAAPAISHDGDSTSDDEVCIAPHALAVHADFVHRKWILSMSTLTGSI